MSNILLSAPVAFLIYLLMAGLLNVVGQVLAGLGQPSEMKSSIYTSGESLDKPTGAPGYRPFFTMSLFFAVLHLGVLMLGSGSLNWMSVAYLVGLIFVLIALILG